MRAFLSYHRPDNATARSFKAALERARPDIDVFLDTANLRPGNLWQPALFEAISQSDCFLILVGNALGEWQKIEYYEARDRSVKDGRFLVLPIIIADRTRSALPNLPGLSQIHWIECPDPAHPEPLAQILAVVSGGPLTSRELWRTINPYRGLSALREEDSDFFFGRERETEDILAAVERIATAGSPDRKMVVVLGNSGVGKSSLMQAGVIGSLKRRQFRDGKPWPQERLSGSRGWAFLTMRPGEKPVRALVSAFVDLWFEDDPTSARRFNERDAWVERLDGKGRLSDLIDATQDRFRKSGFEPPRRVLLYIDQREELYSYAVTEGRNPRESGLLSPTVLQFSKLLTEALGDDRLIVLMSQRSDYYGHLQAHEALFNATVRVDLPPLGANELKTVMSEPARLLGVKFESTALVDRMVEAGNGQPGALPLLADFMTDLWERMQLRGDGVLRFLEQKGLLNVGGALSARADRFLAENPGRVELFRRLFVLRLVIVQEQGEPLRRRVTQSACTPEDWQLITELAGPKWRLLVTGMEQGEPAAEIAHEILLTEWPTLSRWLESERAFLVWRNQVEGLRKTWQSAPEAEKQTALLTGYALVQACRWLKARKQDIDPAERKFIVASIPDSIEFKFSLFDKVKLGATVVLFMGLAAFMSVGKIAVMASNPIAAMGAIVGLAGILFRQFTVAMRKRTMLIEEALARVYPEEVRSIIKDKNQLL